MSKNYQEEILKIQADAKRKIEKLKTAMKKEEVKKNKLNISKINKLNTYLLEEKNIDLFDNLEVVVGFLLQASNEEIDKFKNDGLKFIENKEKKEERSL